MARIADEDINKVIEANDLVAIAAECIPDLKQKGGRFIACCPFHKEKTPSFQIDQNKQLWHCFGCGEGGNIVTFVEKIYDMNFVEAMEFLADKANIELKKTAGKHYDRSEKGKILEACKLAALFYHNQLTKVKSAGSNAARKYLSSRDLNSEIAKKWSLGYAPGNNELIKFLTSKKVSIKTMIDANLAVNGNDGRAHDRFFNRIMFPIFDTNSNVIAFGGRVMDDSQPKYLNTGETPVFHKSKVLFGLEKAKSNMASSGIAIVVEGYTDVIAMHEAGINYAVATLGTALTKQHIRILNQHAKQKIIYLFDGDEAGQRAADRALNFIDELSRPEIHGKRAQLMALTLPENLDPKEYIDKYGSEKLSKLLEQAKPLLDYGIERRISKYDLSVGGNKSKAAYSALQVLAPIKDSLLAKEYCSIIADATGMRSEDLISQLATLKKPIDYEGETYSQNPNELKIKPSAVTKAVKLEKEFLCIIAKHPADINKIIGDNFDYCWCSANHEKLFNYILDEIKQNPKIKANELIMAINQKNQQTANMLTSISKMYDIKNNPVNHGKYLILLMKIESINTEIKKLKACIKTNDDDENNSAFKKLVHLQNEQNKLKFQASEMI